MNKYIIGAMFVIAIALLTLPSYADNVGYDATVVSGQNTFIQTSNGNFGTILVGESKTITGSVTLNNTGDVNATVDAKFSTNVSSVYGLVDGSNVLNATNFALNETSVTRTWTDLNNTGADVRIGKALPNSVLTVLDAKLLVPAAQPAGAYSGTVVLTFGNEV